MGKVIVLGASPNPYRYSFRAVLELLHHGYEVVPLGNRQGSIGNARILIGKPEIENVDIAMLYLNREKQREYYEYIIGLNPKKILFNPGTENPELANLALSSGIEILYDCALVILNSNNPVF
jgi:uncharacterized protein